jgi:hypothetical protein
MGTFDEEILAVSTPKDLEELARKTGRKATPASTVAEEAIGGFEKARIGMVLERAGIA